MLKGKIFYQNSVFKCLYTLYLIFVTMYSGKEDPRVGDA